MKRLIIHGGTLALLCLGLTACVNVPAEVVQLHEKEETIAKELQRTHLNLVDGYVDQRLATFENFYFKTYGPAYLKNWKEEFKTQRGRDYDEAKDFPELNESLVAEYQDLTKPIEEMRYELKAAVTKAYAQLDQSHDSVHAWLISAKKLSDSERALTNKLLGAVDPELSLGSIDQRVTDLKDQLLNKIN